MRTDRPTDPTARPPRFRPLLATAALTTLVLACGDDMMHELADAAHDAADAMRDAAVAIRDAAADTLDAGADAAQDAGDELEDVGVADAQPGVTETVLEAPCERMAQRTQTFRDAEGGVILVQTIETWGADFTVDFDPTRSGGFHGVACGRTWRDFALCPEGSTDCVDEGGFSLDCVQAVPQLSSSTVRVGCGSVSTISRPGDPDSVQDNRYETARVIVRR